MKLIKRNLVLNEDDYQWADDYAHQEKRAGGELNTTSKVVRQALSDYRKKVARRKGGK